jgi:hypothetical protein
MPSIPLHSRALPTLLAAALTTVAFATPAQAAPPPSADAAVVSAAASYLASRMARRLSILLIVGSRRGPYGSAPTGRGGCGVSGCCTGAIARLLQVL